VKPLLALTGTNPTFDTVRELLTNAKAGIEAEKQDLLNHIERLYFEGAKYSLIPVSEIDAKEKWEEVSPVPLSHDHICTHTGS
jgi:hypothetical protein